MSEEANLDAYLKRINFAGSIAPTVQTLEKLQALHVAAIPFENLDPLMELPVRLQLSDIEQKLVNERRGGYCFEQNILFKAVLDTLGYKTRQFAARVLWGEVADTGQPLSHMALGVDIGGVPYLVDTGFGGQVLTAPLKLRADLEQETPNDRYRLLGGTPQWRLESEIAGEWKPLYAFELIDRTADEYRDMNERTSVSFRDFLAVARSEPGTRYALSNNRLNIHRSGQETETRMLGGLLEIRDVLTNVFGIQLPQTDRLDPALEKALRPVAAT